MARMLSSLASVIRGSIGGLTFTANQFQAIVIRARTSPTNPKTSLQTMACSAFSDAQALWRNATSAVRGQWINYAKSLEYSGPTGDYKVTGRHAFMASIQLAAYALARGYSVGSTDTDAPTEDGFLDIGNVQETPALAPLTGCTISVENNSGEAVVAMVQFSKLFDDSRQRYQGPWQESPVYEGECADQATTLVSVLGGTDDQIRFLRVRCVSAEAPYRISAEYIVRCTVVTTV